MPAGYSFEFSGNFWESGTATFHIGLEGDSPTGGPWKSAFSEAMDSWTNATAFQFVAVDDFVDPCIARGDGLFGDEVTGIDFTDTICGTAYGENVLAVTLTAGTCIGTDPDCPSFHITDADIVFNSNESWDVYTGPLRFNNTIDFRRVALHELGHALGLDHEQTNPSIMQALVDDSDTLQQDDIIGANFIYGAESTQSTVYGIDVVLPTDATISGPSNELQFDGSLENTDAQFDSKFIDIYQYTFENDSSIDIQLASNEFNTFLYLARISSTQDLLGEWVFTDDNSDSGTNSRIFEDIQAGTYWIGVSSGSNNQQGDYSVTVNSSDNGPGGSFTRVPSGFGVDVEINPNPSISGALSGADFIFEGKFLDLYQFEVINPVSLRINLRSTEFDSFMILADVSGGTVGGQVFVQNDDVSSRNRDSQIERQLQPGTYWIAATSFDSDETGNYTITSTVILP